MRKLKINTDETPAKNKIIPYSDKKINVKVPPIYSVLNPDTNSDSPSEKSKGERFVSAKQQNNHNNVIGKQQRNPLINPLWSLDLR